MIPSIESRQETEDIYSDGVKLKPGENPWINPEVMQYLKGMAKQNLYDLGDLADPSDKKTVSEVT